MKPCTLPELLVSKSGVAFILLGIIGSSVWSVALGGFLFVISLRGHTLKAAYRMVREFLVDQAIGLLANLVWCTVEDRLTISDAVLYIWTLASLFFSLIALAYECLPEEASHER